MKSQIFSLQPQSRELHQALFYGVLERNGHSFRVFPQELLHERGILKKVIALGVPVGEWKKPPFWRVLLKVLHPEKLGLTLFPALLMMMDGLSIQGWPLHSVNLILSVCVVLCLQSSMQMFNDVEDHFRLVDLPHSDRRQGRGVLQLGWMSAQSLKRLGWIFFTLGVALGSLVLYRTQDVFLFVLGGVGLLGLLSYSGSGVGLKYRAWGDLLILWMTGPVLCLGWSLVAFQEWSSGVISLGLFSGLMNASVFICRHIQTLEMDRQTGILTLPLVLGFKNSRIALVSLYALSLLSLCVFAFSESSSIDFALAGGVGALAPVRQIHRLYSVSGPLSAQLSGFTYSALLTHFWVFVCVALGLFLKF